MNPQFRTAALIAAALGLIISLYFALTPGDDNEGAATTAAQTAPATAATEPDETLPAATTTAPATTAPTAPEVVKISITVPGDKAPTVKHFTISQDRQVELVVTSALADEVHVHGYDLSADVAPGAPATIRFKANAPGLFEVELESRGLPIAELEVRP